MKMKNLARQLINVSWLAECGRTSCMCSALPNAGLLRVEDATPTQSIPHYVCDGRFKGQHLRVNNIRLHSQWVKGYWCE